MEFVDPGLLDVVPWSYGYAHSWALAALLNDERTAGPILELLRGLPGPLPYRVLGPVERERRVGSARADLAFTLLDAAGGQWQIAAETKVNDPFREEQMLAYGRAVYQPVLYLPGLTGLLLEPTAQTSAREVRLLGGDVIEALEGLGVGFGALLGGYLDAVRGETHRMARACTHARDETAERPGQGQCAEADLMDVAWLAETFRALPHACVGTGVSPDASMRVEANDRGFFFDGSFTRVAQDGALWVDVVVDVRTHARGVAIKAGEQDLAGAWDLAGSRAGGPGNEWRRASRRLAGKTATVWKRPLEGVCAEQAATVAVQAARFLREL